MRFSLAGNSDSLVSDGGVYTETLSQTFFSCAQLVRVWCHVVVTRFSSCLAQVQALCIVHSLHPLGTCHVTPLMTRTPSSGTCTPFTTTRPTSTSSNFLSRETNPCADPQQMSTCYLADPTTFTFQEGLQPSVCTLSPWLQNCDHWRVFTCLQGTEVTSDDWCCWLDL